jgi:TolB-like protein/AraC-like DNA-binding protein/Tfp pilus assembly protein PilF
MTEPFSSDQELISRLTEIILSNLGNEKFGVNELVRKSDMSLYRLSRKLHSINKKTINQFIREVHLNKALEMLQDGEYTASEVAYRTGFSSPAYFTKRFHEYFGYPPGKVKHGDAGDKAQNSLTQPTGGNEPGKSMRKTNLPSYPVIIFLTLVISILAYLFYPVLSKYFSNGKSDPAINPDKSIAVLPFKNLGDITADQYFIDGVMDEIFINLSRIHDLRVVSRTSVEQFRNTSRSIPEIGKKLHSDYIVEGSGQKYGNTIRLRVQLIEASKDKHLWAESYEQEILETKDIFAIQSRIAQTIASQLHATITLEEQELIDKVPTANLTAYDLYRKANEFQKQYLETSNLNTYSKAVTLYKAALEIDSSFARAYSDLASLYLARYYWETYFKEDFLDSCLVLAKIALSYDGKIEEAYHMMGRCWFEKGDIEKSLFNFNKALEINPNYSDAWAYQGYLFTSVADDYIMGIESYRKSVSTGPPEYLATLLRGLGQAYLDVGFIEEAKNCYNQAFRIDGDVGLHLFNLSDIEYCLENYEEAIRLANEANKADSAYFPETSYYYGPVEHTSEAYMQAQKLIRKFERSGPKDLNQAHRIGYALWKAGKHREADSYFKMQLKNSQESIKLKRYMSLYKGAYYDLAAIYAFLGDRDKAYQYLDEFSKKSFYPLWWVTLAKHDPLFTSIRNDEKFQRILKAMQSKYQAEHERVKKWLEGNAEFGKGI